jgi:hypothetical protein
MQMLATTQQLIYSARTFVDQRLRPSWVWVGDGFGGVDAGRI